MKYFIPILFLFVIHNIAYPQFYERSGKNLGIYVSLQPLASYKTKSSKISMNTMNASVGIVSKILPGVYPSVGYTFAKTFEQNRSDAFPLKYSQTLDAGVLFDKRIAKLFNQRIKGRCHYISLGLIMGPEYHYMLGTKENPNYAFGEIAGQIGFSFYHVVSSASKKSRSRTTQYDFFYRKGFTPIYSSTISTGQLNIYRQEIGLRIRFIKHQVYNFLQ